MELSTILAAAEPIALSLTQLALIYFIFKAHVVTLLLPIKSFVKASPVQDILKVLWSYAVLAYLFLGLILDPLILVGFWALIGLPIVGAKLWRAIRWSIEEIGYLRKEKVAKFLPVA